MYSKDPHVVPFDPTTDYIVSLLSVSVLIGSMIGSMAVTHLMDKYGRRKVSIVSSCLAAVLNLLTMIPVHWAYLFTIRVLLGIPGAALKTTFPAWVAELATTEQRGILNVMLQMFYTVGIMASSVMLLIIGTHDEYWWTSFLPTTVFCVISVVFCWLLPEPTHIEMIKISADEQPDDNNEDKLTGDDVQEYIAHDADKPVTGTWKQLFTRKYIKVLLAAICLGIAQQGSGANSVIIYATATFQNAFSDDPDDYYSAIYGSLMISVVNFVCTLVALPLVNRLGRRIIYFTGFALCAIAQVMFIICYAGSTQTWMLITASCIFLFGFEAGPGPCYFVLTGELFPLAVRAKCCGLSFTVNWLTCIFVVMIFPFFSGKEWGAYTIYLILMGSAVIVMWFVMPETKGKTLEQIEKEIVIGGAPD